MSNKRIFIVEGSGQNPALSFRPTFAICKGDGVHGPHTFQDVEAVGPDGATLVKAVLAINGVKSLSISKHELRVFKHSDFEWNELDSLIRREFVEVFRELIEFVPENPIAVWIKRLKTVLGIKPKD